MTEWISYPRLANRRGLPTHRVFVWPGTFPVVGKATGGSQMQTSKMGIWIGALVLSGCASVPQPYITEFDDDSVRVVVNYDILGPDMDDAALASQPMAEEQCSSYQKGTDLVSRFMQPVKGFTGIYVFLYRCTGADVVRIEK